MKSLMTYIVNNKLLNDILETKSNFEKRGDYYGLENIITTGNYGRRSTAVN